MTRPIIALLCLLFACDGQLRFDDRPDAAVVTDPRCQVETDCPDASLHCDVVSHRCVGCRDDVDCSGGAPRCDLALHRCVECGADLDCAAGSSCEATTRRCVIACAEGQTEHVCPATAPTCNEVAGFCVQCGSDLECRDNTDDGTYCDQANGRCVFCVEDAQCAPPTPRCDRTRGRCAQCMESADCPIGRLCNPHTLTCMLGS